LLNYLVKYFSLNRRERNAIITLITLLLVLTIARYVSVHSYAAPATRVVVVELDSVAAKLAVAQMTEPEDKTSGFGTARKKNHKDTLFYFDPNTVSLEQAMLLGFNKGCATMLMNYRNKGGRFYKPSDLQKLYCMETSLYGRLEPYIVIGGSRETKQNATATKKAGKENFTLEINSADSTEWLKLNGIGPGYTRRILKYKSLLGGFTAIEQLREVYYFSDSLYDAIKDQLTVNPAAVQKLKVNSVDFKTMVHHPYIKYEGTKCIFALKRNKKIKEEDLVGSSCFSREQLQKLLPYLDFE
jgi:competence protein ComEA